MVATTLVMVPIHGEAQVLPTAIAHHAYMVRRRNIETDERLLVHVTPESASQPLELTPRATAGEECASMSCRAFPTSSTIVGVCIDLRDSSSAPPQRQIDLNYNALSTRLPFLPPHVFERPLAVSVLPVADPTSMRRMPKVPPHRPHLSWWPPVMGWMGLVMGLVVVAAGQGWGVLQW
jgi:hypothetical protein